MEFANIDDHSDTRDLTIACTAIVVVWSIACGLTFVSAHLYRPEKSSLDGPTALIGDWLSHEALR
jgi:hypothetical protein